jgi:glycosyltransferase involved in cell wall biosynthesis
MKITIITSPFSSIPPNTIGAVERLWYNLAKIFCERGHTISFLSKKYNQEDVNGKNKDGIDVTYIKGFSVKNHILKSLFFDFIYSFNTLLKLKKTDVLVMNTFWTPLLCVLFKRKYTVSIYNVERFPKGQFKYYRNVERLSCVSQAVYNELKKQIPTTIKRAKVISNPVDTNSFHYKEESDYLNKVIISYAGRVHPEKGIEILVKAYDKLKKDTKHKNIELRIIGARNIENGGGGDSYIELLKQNTQYEITFVDPIFTPQELSREVAKCNIFCYPSIAEKGETFGVAPLEAMAVGRAVIVSDLDCFKDFVQNRKNAFIFDHRENAVENLVVILDELIDNKELRYQVGEKAAQTALNFSTPKIADLYLDDFIGLLKEKDNV